LIAQQSRSAAQFSDTSRAPPPADAVRASLERILASPDFGASARATEFLRYIVEETLAGRSERIKAFSVAQEVFGRDDTFDAQGDPVVRIEAGRLRRKLEHYYLLSGKSDPVVIEVPKGGYVPTFRWNTIGDSEVGEEAPVDGVDIPAPEKAGRTPRRWVTAVAASVVPLIVVVLYLAGVSPFRSEPPASPPTGPRLIVLPFADLGEGTTSALYSAALIDDIITHLGRHKEITVLGAQTSRAAGANADPALLRRDLAVHYALEGSVEIKGERVRVAARLVDAADGAVLWSRSFDDPLTPANLIDIHMKTAEEVATALAQPYGIVFQAEVARESAASSGDLSAYLCTLRYYTYRLAMTAEKHADVRNCLEQAVERFPDYAVAWALLSYLYIDEDRYGFNPRPDSRSRALNSAQEGTRLDPQNARVMQALMMALFFNHRADKALQIGAQAAALNPNDPELLGQLGLINAMSGSAEEGHALLETALARNPAHAGYYHGVLAMGAYVSGNYDRALVEIEQVDMRKIPIYPHVVAAMIYAQAGRDEQARAELAEFQRLAPDFIPNLWAELDKRGFSDERQRRVVDGLRKAGATVPPKPGRAPENTPHTTN